MSSRFVIRNRSRRGNEAEVFFAPQSDPSYLKMSSEEKLKLEVLTPQAAVPGIAKMESIGVATTSGERLLSLTSRLLSVRSTFIAV